MCNARIYLFYRYCTRYDYTALRNDLSLPQKIRLEKTEQENVLRGLLIKIGTQSLLEVCQSNSHKNTVRSLLIK